MSTMVSGVPSASLTAHPASLSTPPHVLLVTLSELCLPDSHMLHSPSMTQLLQCSQQWFPPKEQ